MIHGDVALLELGMDEEDYMHLTHEVTCAFLLSMRPAVRTVDLVVHFFNFPCVRGIIPQNVLLHVGNLKSPP